MTGRINGLHMHNKKSLHDNIVTIICKSIKMHIHIHNKRLDIHNNKELLIHNNKVYTSIITTILNRIFILKMCLFIGFKHNCYRVYPYKWLSIQIKNMTKSKANRNICCCTIYLFMDYLCFG